MMWIFMFILKNTNQFRWIQGISMFSSRVHSSRKNISKDKWDELELKRFSSANERERQLVDAA
jgi:hypothetical protein